MNHSKTHERLCKSFEPRNRTSTLPLSTPNPTHTNPTPTPPNPTPPKAPGPGPSSPAPSAPAPRRPAAAGRLPAPQRRPAPAAPQSRSPGVSVSGRGGGGVGSHLIWVWSQNPSRTPSREHPNPHLNRKSDMGIGQKKNAGFSPCVHLPGVYFGRLCLTHSHFTRKAMWVFPGGTKPVPRAKGHQAILAFQVVKNMATAPVKPALLTSLSRVSERLLKANHEKKTQRFDNLNEKVAFAMSSKPRERPKMASASDSSRRNAFSHQKS